MGVFWNIESPMRVRWKSHGSAKVRMGVPMESHGTKTNIAWEHLTPVELSWGPTEATCKSHGTLMGFPWEHLSPDEALNKFAWESLGSIMETLWKSHESTMEVQ